MICFFVANNAKSQLLDEILFVRNTEKQQKGFAIGKINISNPLEKSLKDYFQITDTLDFTHNQWDLVKVEGSDFQFNLTIHRDSTVVKVGDRKRIILESLIPPHPLWRYDITSLDTCELDMISLKLREMPYDTIVLRQAFQTCISYALEGIFNSHGIDSEPFFFRRSNLSENDLEVILDNMFVKVETLPNIRRRTLSRSQYLHENQVFILFRNIRGDPIHACFNLQDRTWTKNGKGPFTSHLTPFPVIDVYNTKKIIRSDFSETGKELFRLASVESIEIYLLNSDFFN